MDYFKRLKKEKKREKKEPWRFDQNLRVQSEVSMVAGLNWQQSVEYTKIVNKSFWSYTSTFSPVGRTSTELELCNFSCSRQETRCSLVITGQEKKSGAQCYRNSTLLPGRPMLECTKFKALSFTALRKVPSDPSANDGRNLMQMN